MKGYAHITSAAADASLPTARKKAATRITVNAENARIFNRLAIIVTLMLLVAAAVQQVLFNRLLGRLERKMEAHTASMQQVSQALQQDVKRLSQTGTQDYSEGSASANESTTAGGSQSELTEQDIVLVQKKLKQQGFTPGNIEGKMDPQTLQALQQFQQANNLPIGQLDGLTLRHLGVSMGQIN